MYNKKSTSMKGFEELLEVMESKATRMRGVKKGGWRKSKCSEER